MLTQLSERLTEYFRHNDIEEIFPTSLWAAHKAVMRGRLIEISTSRKWQKQHETRKLTSDLEKLYYRHTQTPSQELLLQINKKRRILDDILSEHTEKSLRWSKARFLFHSNSASTMFTRKLKQTTQPTHLYKLKDCNGNLTTHLKQVLSIFSSFYQKLYFGPDPFLPSSPQTWLDTLSPPPPAIGGAIINP